MAKIIIKKDGSLTINKKNYKPVKGLKFDAWANEYGSGNFGIYDDNGWGDFVRIDNIKKKGDAFIFDLNADDFGRSPQDIINQYKQN